MATLITHNHRNEPSAQTADVVRPERWTPFLWAMLCLCVAASAIVVKQSGVRPQPLMGAVKVSMDRPGEAIPGTDWGQPGAPGRRRPRGGK